MAELHNIRFLRWNGYASGVAKIIEFFENESIKELKFERKQTPRLTVSIIMPVNHNLDCVFELEKEDVLVYSPTTGYQVVSTEIFETFVKT